MAAISNSIRSAIRLRLAVHHFGSLPVGLGLTTAQIGLLLTLTLAGDLVSPCASRREPIESAAAHAGCRRHSNGCCRPGLCLHQKLLVPDYCGHDRRDQSERS